MTEDAPFDGDYVQSLERGLSVIRAFDADHPRLTLSEVASATGMSRAAARRFLHTLVHLGYMHNNNGRFSLRPRILELGYAYLSSLTLPEVAMPHLEELVEQVRESSSVSELDGEDVVYIARVPTKRIMTVAISVGTRFPAYATSMGRVLLAAQPEPWLDNYLARTTLRGLTGHTITSPAELRVELRKIKARGWALVDQELEEGVRSIAAPIRDADGRAVAAINISTSAGRRSIDSIVDDLLGPLLATAERIERDLSSSASPRRQASSGAQPPLGFRPPAPLGVPPAPRSSARSRAGSWVLLARTAMRQATRASATLGVHAHAARGSPTGYPQTHPASGRRDRDRRVPRARR